MKNNQKIAEAVKALAEECVKKLQSLYQGEEITDFYIQFMPSENMIRIVDDDETLIARVALGSMNEDEDNEAAETTSSILVKELQNKLAKMNEDKMFDNVNVFHPFSFVYEDEEGNMQDILIVDDANLIINDELLKGLDDDLDTFIDNLLKD